MPAAASAGTPLETARFKVSVKGAQTTAWSYAYSGGGLCNPGGRGEGTEVVRFASSTPKLMVATRFSPSFVQFGSGEIAGVLGMRAKVTRRAKLVHEPVARGCVDPKGPATRPIDCGTKHSVMDLRVSYEGFDRPSGVKLRDAHAAHVDPFENCPVNGVAFPTLLDQTTNGKGIASDWPVREIMDRRVGKTIVIGRGRKVVHDAGSRQETTIRWELTFRRVR